MIRRLADARQTMAAREDINCRYSNWCRMNLVLSIWRAEERAWPKAGTLTIPGRSKGLTT
jgi:hypothetical protein